MAITLCHRCDRRIDTDDGECVVDPDEGTQLICMECAIALEPDDEAPTT